MKKLLTQVTLDRSNRKKDKSVSITFITQLEQSSEEFMNIDKLTNSSGVLYFKSDGDLTDEELKAIDVVKIESEGKSKSQRLRNVLYRFYEQKIKPHNKGFIIFYANEMERIIEHYKSKLD